MRQRRYQRLTLTGLLFVTLMLLPPFNSNTVFMVAVKKVKEVRLQACVNIVITVVTYYSHKVAAEHNVTMLVKLQ